LEAVLLEKGSGLDRKVAQAHWFVMGRGPFETSREDKGKSSMTSGMREIQGRGEEKVRRKRSADGGKLFRSREKRVGFSGQQKTLGGTNRVLKKKACIFVEKGEKGSKRVGFLPRLGPCQKREGGGWNYK